MISKINILLFCSLILFILFAPEIKSQTIYICDQNITDGEPKGEVSKMKIDQMKENFAYILVKFPSAYGCNQIKFQRFLVGNPSPAMTMDVDPSATWACYEMSLIDQGEYRFKITDCNDVELGQAKLSVGLK